MDAMVGTQLKWAAEVVRAMRQPVLLGRRPHLDPAQRVALAGQLTRLVMQVVVSLFVVGLSALLLIQSNNETLQKAGFSLIGTVLGYWLR